MKEKLLQTFGVGENDLIMDRELLKASVALGACEEQSLRREFGSEGFIRYSGTDFLNSLPYSIGLLHRELSRLGYKNGFAPIFRRETKTGSISTLDSENCFLIHSEMRELALYADYHDGHAPVYIGWFDWSNPDGKEDLDKILQPASSDEEAEEESNEEFDYDNAEENPEKEDDRKLFAVQFVLEPNRRIKAIDLTSGKYYLSKQVTEKWANEENPFSGIH